jgi:hypothetical protein
MAPLLGCGPPAQGEGIDSNPAFQRNRVARLTTLGQNVTARNLLLLVTIWSQIKPAQAPVSRLSEIKKRPPPDGL